jgi:K+-sensing histidine kinase KdpD
MDFGPAFLIWVNFVFIKNSSFIKSNFAQDLNYPMNIILLILAGVAAGGVAKAVHEIRRQTKERKQQKEALERFEQQHPGK